MTTFNPQVLNEMDLRIVASLELVRASWASRSACSLSQRRWYREMSRSSHWHSATVFTPRAKTSAMATSSSVALGRSEAPEVARSQDLTMSWTRESLAAGSTLMKLAEGRGERGEGPLATWVAAPAASEGARCSCLAGACSLDDRLPDRGRSLGSHLPHLRWGRGHGLTWLFRSSASSELAHSRLLPAGHKGCCLQEKDLVYIFQEKTNEGGVTSRMPYPLGLLSNKALPLLLSPAFCIGCHLFGSGVPGLKDCQPCPRLVCIQQKGSQALGRLSTLGVILKNQKASRGKKELPVTRLAPLLLGPLYRLNCLSHELSDGPRLIILAYIELEVVGGPPLTGRGFPEELGTSPQLDSRRRKKKSYLQYFTFDFFSMAVMKPDLLLKQYHLKSLVSLGAF
ncbi:LOW QUALITY PROTEIN: hypothetical protein Cgig2_005900 [Carnegiea gigantea]|uniref:Uncharacterized protein n=1 Tax=Carnegiea gigantea TaxID=171969 RepID=A0A9Q1Q4U0_9CARY|nr:LOW QUALITY PROTEIN: hypothetical protein Cgig2_005900 [Carnegiea gigantea]